MFIVIVIISLRTIKVNDSVYTLGCECCTICITSLFSSKKRESLSPVRKWLVPEMVDWRRNGKTRATTWLPFEMYRELYRSEQMLPSVAATMRILFFVVYYRGLWRTWSVATYYSPWSTPDFPYYNLIIAYSFWYTTSLHSMYFKTTICFTCILLILQSLAVASFLGILKSADFLLWLRSLIHFLHFKS
jgi:hypothetical protein